MSTNKDSILLTMAYIGLDLDSDSDDDWAGGLDLDDDSNFSPRVPSTPPADARKGDISVSPNLDQRRKENDPNNEENWKREQYPANLAALKRMRQLIPPDVHQHPLKSLVADGLPKAAAKRLLEKPVLWLLRLPPAEFPNIHSVDLMGQYTWHGLDLTEMRALYMVIPPLTGLLWHWHWCWCWCWFDIECWGATNASAACVLQCDAVLLRLFVVLCVYFIATS
jgi:hypothetical protein